ncbi:MAG: hypothetical protein PHN49_07845 [Candidatus Omnitrophica bacterium]|nr:hypothetical protein [Candidatus Omnitrophota bacterium]MDD5671536.1 hypothetical protein [Candidatus Omnitrophota bacterium]
MTDLSSTQIAALLNHSLNHVLQVCVLELLVDGHLRDVDPNEERVCLKFVSQPSLKYQRVVVNFYQDRRSVEEAVDDEIVAHFLVELLDSLLEEGLLEKHGIVSKKFICTPAGERVAQSEVEWLKRGKSTLARGLNKQLIRAFAVSQEVVFLFSPRFRGLFRLRAAEDKKPEDWFYATWHYANRYEAMKDAIRQRFGL